MTDLIFPRSRAPVQSVFGRIGAVTAQANDYAAAQIGVAATPENYAPTGASVEGHLAGIDAALASLPTGYDDDDVIDLLTEVVEDGWRLRWDVEVDSLGTHFFPDVVMENHDETYASEITIDLARANNDRRLITLEGNPTLLVTNFAVGTDPERPGKVFRIVATQDATGGRSIDFAGSDQTWLFPDGEPSLCAVPGGVDELEFVVTSVDPPEFTFIRPIHRPRRADSSTEEPSTASVVTTQQGESSFNAMLYELWKFEEATGASRTGEILAVDLDEMGSAVDQTTGIDGNGVNLNSGYELETAFMALGSPPGSDVSLSFWLYPRAADDDVRFQVKNSSVNASLIVEQIDAGGGSAKARASVTVWTGAIGETDSVTSTGTLTLNAWNLLAVKLTATHVFVSLNGSAFQSTARTHTGTLFGTTPDARLDTAGLVASDADVDEPAIWAAALSDSNIAALWASGSGLFHPFASGANEEQTLTITGTPTSGSFVLTIDGEAVTIPSDASAGTIETLVNAALGPGSVDVTGGPLPGTPAVIEFVGSYAGTNVPDSSVDDSGLAGHAALDWRREINYVLLNGGTYDPTVELGDVQPSQTIRLAIENDGASGTLTLDGVDFGDEGDPTLPASGKFDLFELTAVDPTHIVGRTLQTGLTP